MRPVLILGGYGNFGKRIAGALVGHGVPVIIAGRDPIKASTLAASLSDTLATPSTLDVHNNIRGSLKRLSPGVVINTCGPFQNSDYRVAEACIDTGVHYIDLADGRDFVCGIRTLDKRAKAAGVAVISGASTVPGLSSAVLNAYQADFSEIHSLRFGISPGQKAERGLATTQGILSYVGKPLKPFASRKQPAYGWQDIHRQAYPALGKRWMANCDIPDLDLLPNRYGIRDIRFSAGLELGVLHLGLWGLSWLVRLGLPINLSVLAKPLLTASNWLNAIGSADGGMHMVMAGLSPDGAPYQRSWFIIARDGDGPHIPTVPAIVLAKRLARGETEMHGALPCVGLVSLPEYLDELKSRAIETHTEVGLPLSGTGSNARQTTSQ